MNPAPDLSCQARWSMPQRQPTSKFCRNLSERTPARLRRRGNRNRPCRRHWTKLPAVRSPLSAGDRRRRDNDRQVDSSQSVRPQDTIVGRVARPPRTMPAAAVRAAQQCRPIGGTWERCARAEFCGRRPRSCGVDASSWPPGMYSNAPKSGARPMPTCARRSTFASTTPPVPSTWRPQRCRRARRGEPLRVSAARRGGGHRAWNFPLAILTGMTTAALATGNTVIMKPAEQSSVIAAKLMEIFREAGAAAGRGELSAGPRRRSSARRWSSIPTWPLIAFTGSRAVGLAINARAAEVSATEPGKHVKHVIAEMGGKNAIIVDDDADLDEAVPASSTARSAIRARSARPVRGRSCWMRSTTQFLDGWSRPRAA